MANLIALFNFDKNKVKEWSGADKKARLRDFAPVKVRLMLEKAPGYMFADEQWYADISEAYIHITPQTQPNIHSGRTYAGQKVDKNGLDKCLKEICQLLWVLATFAAKEFGFDDLFEKIVAKSHLVPFDKASSIQ